MPEREADLQVAGSQTEDRSHLSETDSAQCGAGGWIELNERVTRRVEVLTGAGGRHHVHPSTLLLGPASEVSVEAQLGQRAGFGFLLSSAGGGHVSRSLSFLWDR